MKRQERKASAPARALSLATRLAWALTPRPVRRRLARAWVGYLRKSLDEDADLRARLLAMAAERVSADAVAAGTLDKNLTTARRDLRATLGECPELDWVVALLDDVARRVRAAAPAAGRP